LRRSLLPRYQLPLKEACDGRKANGLRPHIYALNMWPDCSTKRRVRARDRLSPLWNARLRHLGGD
jgi:hypothetical protein